MTESRFVQSTIVDVSMTSRTLPVLPSPFVERPDLLQAIERQFASRINLLVVMGEEGIGKTTLLAKFALEHSRHCVALFVRPSSRSAYDPAYLRMDLCNQLYAILHGVELDSDIEITEALRSTLLFQLQSKARWDDKPYYFILDGIDDIPAQHTDLRQQIIDLLPVGMMPFRCVISGSTTSIAGQSVKPDEWQPLTVFGFTSDETSQYLVDLNLEPNVIEELREICVRIPARLGSMRRLLEGGMKVNELLDMPPRQLEDLFDLEWKPVRDTSNDNLNLALAILAHEPIRHTLNDLARHVRISVDDLRRLLVPLRFLRLDNSTEEVEFASGAFRDYAARRLHVWKDTVLNLAINDLSISPDSAEALSRLPGYLAEARRYDDLFSYLTPGRFVRMVRQQQSLIPAKGSVELASEHALQLRRNSELAALSVQGALLAELGETEVAHTEVEACIALGDDEGALALARSAMLREDRLQLLALIARTQKRRGEEPDPALLEQMRRLYEQIDGTALGNRAIEIAADLMYSLPDVAVRLLEAASHTEHGEISHDWIAAQLSLENLLAREDSGASNTNTFEQLREQLRDASSYYSSAYAASSGTKGRSAAQAREVISSLDNSRDKVAYLRRWAINNREREDAHEVVALGLKLVVAADDFAPNAAVYRDLAEPLPYVSNHLALPLLTIFDTHKELIKHQGPSQDYVRLQVLLLLTVANYDRDAAQDRLLDLWDYINTLEELKVKAECLAWLVAALLPLRKTSERYGSQPILTHEEEEGFYRELEDLLEQLLEGTADHYQATSGIIRALVPTEPLRARELALHLNTRIRRDSALVLLVRTLVRQSTFVSHAPFLVELFGRFNDPRARDTAMLLILRQITESAGMPTFSIEPFIPLISRAEQILDARTRCNACIMAYQALKKHAKSISSTSGSSRSDTTEDVVDDQYVGLESHLLRVAETAWTAIDVGWLQVDEGFRIATSLATIDPGAANEYAERAKRLRQDLGLQYEEAGLAYAISLSLSIRAFGGIPSGHPEADELLNRLGDLIDELPSYGERAAKWAELALLCLMREAGDFARRLMREHVLPLLSQIPDSNSGYKQVIIGHVAPALYRTSPAAHTWIDQIRRPYRDIAYGQTASFILYRLPPTEPSDERARPRNDLTSQDYLELCDLAEHIEEDSILAWLTYAIADSIVAGRHSGHPGQLTRERQQEISATLRKLVERKLPQKENISHLGFRILAVADTVLMNPFHKPEEWQALVSEANTISNTADKALVLTELALRMPGGTSLRRQTIELAVDQIGQIPSQSDRSGRYTQLAARLLESDVRDSKLGLSDQRTALARQYLKTAMETAVAAKDKATHATQRRIIDLAYGIDENFASGLASLADDDPARLSRHVQALELRQAIGDLGGPRPTGETRSSIGVLARSLTEDPSIAWMLLASLRAGRIRAVHQDWLRELLQVAGRIPLSQAYPVYAWVIENAVARYGQTEQSSTPIVELLHGMLATTEMARDLAAQATAQGQRGQRSALGIAPGDSGLIRVGTRAQVVQRLRGWFAQYAREHIMVCDPYFGPDDLEWLQYLAQVQPDCTVTIVTSRKRQQELGISVTILQEIYRQRWRLDISDQDPPETTIAVLGQKSSGESPLHDRWILARDGGLVLGTSFNSLGITKDARITPLDGEASAALQKHVQDYLQRRVREYRGERLDLVTFIL